MLLPVLASAERSEQSPFRANVRYASKVRDIVKHADDPAQGVQRLSKLPAPFRLTVPLKTQGVVEVTLKKIWHPAGVSYFDDGYSQSVDTAKPIHLRGHVRMRHQGKRVRRAVAATVFHERGKHTKLSLTFMAPSRSKSEAARFYELSIPLRRGEAGSEVQLQAVSHFALSEKTCGNLTSPAKIGIIKEYDSPKIKSIKEVELATEADYEWFETYGSQSNSRIQSLINSVNSIYESQLDLTLSITKQVVVTSSSSRYFSTNSSSLLSEFRSYTNSNGQLGDADVYHLFSGKNFDGSIIGLAYVGVVCAFPTASFGTTQNLSSALNPVITAHEIGHNFSAEHDDATTPATIMSTALSSSNPPTRFSATSISQISSHVSDYGDCLAVTSNPSATPTPTSGGGGGGGGQVPGDVDDPTLKVHLSSSMNKNGAISLGIVEDDLPGGCTLTLRAASTRAKSVTGTVLSTVSGDYTNTTIDTTLSKTSNKKNKKGKLAKVFVVAIRECSGDSSTEISNAVAFRPYAIKVKKKVSLSAWIAALKQAVGSRTPQQQ